MLRLAVDTASPMPPFEQLRGQLAELIRHGVLTPGTRLPPVRQLAADLGLAAGTAARAYHELELAGLVVSRRGGGTKVAEHDVTASRGALLTDRAAAFVTDARLHGATDDEIVSAIRAALKG